MFSFIPCVVHPGANVFSKLFNNRVINLLLSILIQKAVEKEILIIIIIRNTMLNVFRFLIVPTHAFSGTN